MAVETQLLELPFQSGLDQKVDPRWLTIGNQTSLTNGVFRKAGAIEKRFGYTALSLNDFSGDTAWGLTINASGSKLIAFNDQLLQVGIPGSVGSATTTLMAYMSALNRWRQMDYVPECRAFHTGIAEWSTATNTYDTGAGSGYVAGVFTSLPYNSSSTHQVYASVYEYATGSFIYQNYALGTPGTNISVAKIIYLPVASYGAGQTGPMFVVCWYDKTATTDIYANTLNLTTLAWGTATKIVSNFDATANEAMWDISPISGLNDAWCIVYPRDVAGTKRNTLIQLTGQLGTTATSAIAAPAGHNLPGHGYCVAANSTNIFTGVVMDDGANSQTFINVFTPTTLAHGLTDKDLGVNYTGTAKVRITVGLYGTGTAEFVTSNRSATVGMRWRECDSAGNLGNTRTLYNYDVASKPFKNGQVMYVVGAFNGFVNSYTGIGNDQIVQNNGQGTYELIDMKVTSSASTASVNRPVATLAPRLANTMTTGTSAWSSTVPTGVGQPDSAVATFITGGSINAATSGRFSLRALTFAFNGNRHEAVALGESLYFSGGVPSCFDGQQVTEIGFIHAPPGALSIASTNTGGGAMNPGDAHTYFVLYSYVNAKGEIVRSASSQGTQTVGVGDNALTLTLNCNTCTTKQDAENGYSPPIQFAIYRNKNGGSTFYQLVSDELQTSSDPNTYTATYVDKRSDTGLETLNGLPAPVWPGSGGALEGQCPPALQSLRVWNLRLVGIGDDLRSIWYSTQYVVGEQPRFNDNFIVTVDDEIVGIEVMDNSLWIFTEEGILRLSGNGPTEEGQNNDLLAGPDIVPSDVGCIEPRSIIVTNQGIFFQAEPGIYLLTRAGEPMFIGQAVTDSLASYPVIVAATVVSKYNEVRFECRASETSTSGITLVYNYLFKAWSIFDRYDSDQALATAAATSSTVVDGTYYWSNPYGVVYKENSISTAASAYLDGSHWVTLTVESAWAHPSSIIGYALFQYVNVLGVNNDPHDLTVSLASDYNTTYSIDDTFTAQEMQLWSTPLAMAQCQVADQMAASMRVKISDSTPTGLSATTGQGPTLVGLQLQVGNLGGPYRVPPAQGA